MFDIASTRIVLCSAALACSLGGLADAGAVYGQQSGSTPQQGSKTTQSPASRSQTPKNQATDSHPSAAEANPFPEEQAGKAAGQPPTAAPAQNAAGAQSPDQQPGSASPPASTAADNPFPEDVSRKAAADATANAPSVSSGVSSSASRDPVLDRDTDRRRLPKPSRDLTPGSLSGVARAKQDVQVGTYYLGTGAWTGAHARFLEATHDDPANADAIYGLAEAAQHLGRKDEAAANYKLYLDILPDGPRARSAQKMLNTLSAHK